MSCLVAFHYRSYGTFFLQQNRLHNIYRGFTHYKYYRASFLMLRTIKICFSRLQKPKALRLISLMRLLDVSNYLP